jgi:hypothetical protein
VPWEPFVKYGALRATGERVVVFERNEEQGKVRYRRQERVTRGAAEDPPDVPVEETDADDIALDEA